jgi:beta-lactamase regulating signal transducer with metallopeptidase domain
MTFATPGWFAIHALWIGAVIAGAVALALALLNDHRARLRHLVAYAGLLLMVVLPLAATLATLDLFTPAVRMGATDAVENTIGLTSFLEWRARIVTGAALIWAGGLAVFAVRVSNAWRRLRRVQRASRMEAPAAVRQAIAELEPQLGVIQPVSVYESSGAEVPMVFGVRRSTILLPEKASSNLDPDQLKGVLAHELAHVRRRDYAANLLQVVAEAAIWFHPAARWVSRRIRIEREYCCDDEAIRIGADPADYARALARLEDARHDCPLVIAASSGTLLDRIRRIVGHPRPVLTPARAAAAMLSALGLAAAIATLAQVVPPGVPLDAKLRTRRPGPAGTVIPPPGPSFPRTPAR